MLDRRTGGPDEPRGFIGERSNRTLAHQLSRWASEEPATIREAEGGVMGAFELGAVFVVGVFVGAVLVLAVIVSARGKL